MGDSPRGPLPIFSFCWRHWDTRGPEDAILSHSSSWLIPPLTQSAAGASARTEASMVRITLLPSRLESRGTDTVNMADKDRPFDAGLTSWHLYLQAFLTGTEQSGHVTLGAGWPTRHHGLAPAVFLHFLYSGWNQSWQEQSVVGVHCVETDRHTRHEGEVISLRKILIKTNTSISSIIVLFSSSSLMLCQWKAEEEPKKESWPWLRLAHDNMAQGPW